MWIGKLLHPLEHIGNARESAGESVVEGVALYMKKTDNVLTLTRTQKNAILLQINQRLFEKGEISKEIYEAAKAKILLVK